MFARTQYFRESRSSYRMVKGRAAEADKLTAMIGALLPTQAISQMDFSNTILYKGFMNDSFCIDIDTASSEHCMLLYFLKTPSSRKM